MATPPAYDEVAVENTIAGRRPRRLRPADITEIVRRLAGRGYSDGQIAHVLGFRRRSIHRIRGRHHIPAALAVGEKPRVNAPTRPTRLR